MLNQIPEEGFLRLSQIIGNKRTSPPMPPIIPVSKSTWWAGVKTGNYPQPLKIGKRVTVWRAKDIRKLVADLSEAKA